LGSTFAISEHRDAVGLQSSPLRPHTGSSRALPQDWLSPCGSHATHSLIVAWVAVQLLVGPPKVRAQAISVDPPVRISPPGTGNHRFTMITAASKTADDLIACGSRSMPVSNTWQGFVYRSEDAGVHWTTALIDSTPNHLVSEEACALGPDGQVYFIAETWNLSDESPLGCGILRFYRSEDHGLTWMPAMIDPTRDAWMDYARIGVDLTPGPYRGRVYVFSNPGGDCRPRTSLVSPMRYSIDNGEHFSDRVALPLSQPVLGGFPETVQVLPSGTVIAAYVNIYPADSATRERVDTTRAIPFRSRLSLIQIVRSSDGGRHLEPPVTVSRGIGLPAMAVDASPGPRRGRLYVTWADTGANARRAVLTTSDDEGRTWTVPRVVDDWNRIPRAPPLSKRGRYGVYDVHAAVNREGVLGLSWVEDNQCWRFAASLDGSLTFAPSVALNPCPRRQQAAFEIAEHLTTVPMVDPLGQMTSDTADKGFTIRVDAGGGGYGLTADAGGVFHPLWSLPGTDGGLWTTRVVVHGKDVPKRKPTEQSLTGMVDVSGHVTYSFTNQDYDPATGWLAVDISLVNTDSLPVPGPLRLQLTQVRSALFRDVSVMNADNDNRGAGAVWDMSGALPHGELAAYATSLPRRLVFQLSEGSGQFDFIDQQSTVLLVAKLTIWAAPAR
jgi:hypothetical protein